ncbi:hypothetical protein ACIA8C_01800 [Nocardia sp. NPDC051321]|uniref:hypothetical protein n=1 Tax=Nocardia sp. NPDC051321 TaxID=3364323 RepID=UPI00378BD64D
MVVIAVTACGNSDGKEQPNDVRSMDLWQFVDFAEQNTPLTPDRVSKLLGIELKPEEQNPRRNSGGPVTLSGVEITNITAAGSGDDWFASFDTKSGQCITQDDVKKRYPDLKATGAVERKAPGQPVEMSSYRPAAQIIFSFRQSDKCMAGFGLQPPKK